MRRIILAASLVCALGACAAPRPAPPPAVSQALTIELATPEQGAAVLSARDEFMNALTPDELSIRLQRNDAGANVEALGQFYAAHVLPWSAPERARLEAMLARVAPRLAELADWLPERILIAKISPEVESGASAFTRGAVIFIGADGLPAADAALDGLILHETFHLLSRANPERRDALYGVIGFQRCASMDLPAELRARLFTNPDAPSVDHAAPISQTDAALLATPLLIANPARYDPAHPRMFDYLTVEVTPLRRDSAGRCTLATGVTQSQDELTEAIYLRTGRNTGYLFHPEELMADNFAQMMSARADAPNPEVYDRLATVLGMARPEAQ